MERGRLSWNISYSNSPFSLRGRGLGGWGLIGAGADFEQIEILLENGE